MDARRLLGIALGLTVSATLAVTLGAPRRSAPPALTSDVDGALAELVVQYVAEAHAVSAPVYRELFAALPPGVVVWVVCPDRAAFDDLVARVGPTSVALRPVAVGHAMTTWSRDRWIALAPTREGAPPRLLLPSHEAGAPTWPARAGDTRTGLDLADASAGAIAAERSPLDFDGGDFVADGETVFVSPRVLRRNLGRVVRDEAHLREALASLFAQRVVLLREAPDHHAGMYMMTLGERRVLVGDPALARPFVADPAAALAEAGGADFGASAQAAFDAVARQCAEEGYAVTRIPVVPARDGRTYWTWLNALPETRGAGRVVYLPRFDAPPALEASAADTWRALGFTVRSIDTASAYRHFGGLRCLVNVLRRA